jgi:hypothetical protein
MANTRIPLTNLRDSNKGGAPLYVSGDRLLAETTPTAPDFADDDDQYFQTNVRRRGLLSIVHIPAAGASTVDFVTLFARNSSTTQKRYVNVLLAADISVQQRVSGTQLAYPVYGDMIMVEDNGSAQATASVSDTGELSISVTSSGSGYTQAPQVTLDPPASTGLSAVAAVDSTGAVTSIAVVNPSAHSYTLSSPPSVSLAGGAVRELGFFVDFDDSTMVFGSATSGDLTMVGNLGRTAFANSVSSAGDVIIINSELRVVRSVNTEAREVTLDKSLTGSTSVFTEWAYIPYLSASTTSMYRVGNGTISHQPLLGFTGVVCSQPHRLAVGDYIVYQSTAGVFYSHRVTTVSSATEFSVAESISLSSSDAVAWHYVYYLSESTAGGVQSPVKMMTYVKMPYTDGQVVNVSGLHGRQLSLRNKNFFGQPGAYYNSTVAGTASVVHFCNVGQVAATSEEVPNTISSASTLEVVLKPQPAPEVQILASFTMNGGLAGETGARPIIAIYERGRNVTSSDVVYWGYYVRYTPESATNYVQAINV